MVSGSGVTRKEKIFRLERISDTNVFVLKMTEICPKESLRVRRNKSFYFYPRKFENTRLLKESSKAKKT